MKKYAIRILSMLLLLLAYGCAEQNDMPDVDGSETEVTFTISTRASGTPDPEVSSNELINTWWVAFIASDNTIYTAENTLTTPGKQDKVKIKLPPGDYTVVALANQSPKKNDDGSYSIPGLKLVKDENDENKEYELWTESAPEDWDSNHLVPMSGRKAVTVTGKTNQTFSIEVVRQVAKIELQFENVGKRSLTVNSYKIEKFKSDKVYFWPDYESLGDWPKLPEELKPDMQDVNRTPQDVNRTPQDVNRTPQDVNPTQKEFSIGPNKQRSDIFYSLESTAAALPNKVYTLFLNVTHHAGEGWGKTTDEISALITDIGYVNRNDHIIIPVKLTDYLISLKATFYPPIGGYPAVITEDGGGNYYVKFGSIGDFVIETHVRKAVSLGDPGSDNLLNSELDMKIVSIEGDDIFSQKPSIDSNYEIKGKIGTNKGSAKVTISFQIPQDSGMTLNYVRTILIIRE